MDKNINKKFNKLKVLAFDHKGKWNEKYYLFQCDCGNKKIINFQNVKRGKTKSCGCKHKELLSQKLKKTNKYRNQKDYIIGYATNTNNKFYIDKEDYEKICGISWYEQKNGYIAHKDMGKKVILMHRYIINCPKNKIVDHINHNKKDNRKNNLRITDYSLNSLNRKKIPNGICKQKIRNSEYYIIQLNGYRGSYKNYKDAKIKRDEIIKNEYKKIRNGNI